ncbi:hypothetical protein DRQ36_06775 [bacterium]|nr:MAG: hypothetical protein DRQ36_06775 [bacterium]
MKNHAFPIILLFIYSIASLYAFVPSVMNYQGKLTSHTGVGINDTLPMTFSIFDTVIAGSALWTEVHDGDNEVAIIKGLFDVVLGSINPIDLPFDTTYWLEIEVEGDVLVPRVMLNTSPYAFRATIADSVVGGGGADGDWQVSGIDMYSLPTGNVGIGTSMPEEKLQVSGAVQIGPALGNHNGAIQWNGVHFQGYNGTSWVDLDAAGADGVTGIRANTEPWLTGDVTLKAGSNVTLSQAGDTITIAASGSSGPAGTCSGNMEFGSAESSTSLYPFYGFYNYSRSMTLILRSELDSCDGGTIEKLAVFVVSANSQNFTNVEIRMKESPLTTIGTTWDGTGTLIWSGSVAFDTPGWHTFTLSTPFDWTSDNLLITFQWGGSYSTSYPSFGRTSQGSNLQNYGYHDSGYPSSFTATAHRADIRLTFMHSSGSESDGWHGSTTRIKILPSDFMPDAYDGEFGILGNGGHFYKDSYGVYGVATIPIPTGYKATHVCVNAYYSGETVNVYEGYIDDTASESRGTGTTNTEFAITEVVSTDNNYLVIMVHEDAGMADACHIYGGYVTIEAE